MFITGLFAHNVGDKRNVPIVRMGNVALMAEDPIPAHDYRMIAHLIEARSIGGLSGSPAFVRQTISLGFADPKEFDEKELYRQLQPGESPPTSAKLFVTALGGFYLFGLMHGHWDIAASQKNQVLITEDQTGKVNMGIALVVPATQILETLNQPELVAMRKEAHDRSLKDLPPVTLDSPAHSGTEQRTRIGTAIPIPDRKQFADDLWKVTRRKEPSE